MKIGFVCPYTSRLHGSDPSRFLDQVPLLRHLPAELARRGHEVTVHQLFPQRASWNERGVRYALVPPPFGARALATAVGRLSGRDAASFEWASPLVAEVDAGGFDVLHFHGTGLYLNLALLLRRARVPVVLHHHGGALSRHASLRRWQCRILRRARRIVFSTAEHARPYIEAGAIEAGAVVELMETSSAFEPRKREDARRETGLHGDPVLLCAGRLHPVKDPLVVLRGFDRVVAARPEARLYMCYLSDELLPEIRAFLAQNPEVGCRTELLGRCLLAEMEAIFNSADVLLQASVREFSGVAVLDAMACGTVPVVTDIPSFRAMTEGGRYGRLFPVGDDAALAHAVLALSRAELSALSRDVLRHFEATLSFAAMARRLEDVYTDVVEEGLAEHGTVAGGV